jgi:hypothetical protein
MPTRTNACSELVRFWLEARHECLVSEAVPVRVPYGHSDIDLVAFQAAGKPIQLPSGQTIGPRLIVETKDEHDWDPSGREFGVLLRADIPKMGEHKSIPHGTKDVKFSMLREEHFQRATSLLGTDDFDRLFVVHAIDPHVVADLASELADRRIHWLTVPDVVRDLLEWYRAHLRPAALRHTLMGDVFHLLVGFCGLGLDPTVQPAAPKALQAKVIDAPIAVQDDLESAGQA